MNREFLAAILNTLDCRCQFAEDGAEAVAMAELAPFDLILMDMQMPVMDGPTAASRIRTGEGPNRDTPILAVSANVLPEHVAQCLAAGMDDHVPKPIGVADFLGKVGRWLGQRHAAPPDAGARQAS
jgi:CheY-like chemotaxis protein